jgi:hypothetical protein
MNDTETEARHLLAAATEDMPPEIDLLGGFAAARRRVRSRRTRRGAVLSAGIAAAAAAVTAVTLTVGSAPPALAAVTSALSSTLAQSYHLSEQDGYYFIVNGQIRSPHHDTCTTEADPVRQLLATSCPSGIVSREVGGYTYTYIPGPVAGHPGKHWMRSPVASSANQPAFVYMYAYSPGSGGHVLRIPAASIAKMPTEGIGGFIDATPQQMLAQIKQATTVTVIGPASGPGWTGTRYAFSATVYPGTKIELSGTVTVDRQGRARALTLTMRSTGAPEIFPHALAALVTTNALTFSDFGAPVTVTPPPADQTYSVP